MELTEYKLVKVEWNLKVILFRLILFYNLMLYDISAAADVIWIDYCISGGAAKLDPIGFAPNVLRILHWNVLRGDPS